MPKLKKFFGFTLIEMVVAVGIFSVLVVGIIGLFALLTRSVKANREQTILASLATNYLEAVRNLPYTQVGTLSGVPNGTLADQANPINNTIDGISYQIYYEVTYIDDPADGTILASTDPAPNDYKQIKMFIQNAATNVIRSFSTNVTPKGLEGLVNAGALVVKVFDAQGQPVAGASVHIENLSGTINLNRSTDAAGNWIEVGLPAGVNEYEISVTKLGYSTDSTFPITVGNPNPTKPDSTVVDGAVTQVSFSIDLLSNLTIKTLNSVCSGVNGVQVNVEGAKLIGTSPNVFKYNQDLTSAAGQIAMNNIEWDNYTPTLLTGQGLMVVGTSPIKQINVLPAASQTYTLVLATQTANSLLVIVKDAATGNALEGANVHLQGGAPVDDYNAVTGGSIWSQEDWTGGSGQSDFVNPARYFADDGNIDTATLPSGVRLTTVAGLYVASGQLVSSTFDTGGTSNFTTITWQPTSQNPATSLQFQIASNSDNATWNFKGPDGTGSTYYAVSGTNVATVHDNDRYIRYKAFLDTTDNTQTPVLTSIGINYVSDCATTPGQVNFGGLTAASNYSLDVSLAGFTTFNVSSLNISGNQTLEVLMSP